MTFLRCFLQSKTTKFELLSPCKIVSIECKEDIDKKQNHSQDALNCHKHSSCRPGVLLDCILAAMCTISHYLFRGMKK